MELDYDFINVLIEQWKILRQNSVLSNFQEPGGGNTFIRGIAKYYRYEEGKMLSSSALKTGGMCYSLQVPNPGMGPATWGST